MFAMLLALGACTPQPDPVEPAPEPAPEPAIGVLAAAPPGGSISGEPILSRPVVVGGISQVAVDGVIDTLRPSFAECYEPARALQPAPSGKVLLKFLISKSGLVSDVATRATSLRHEPTEACLHGVLSEARFPPLEKGSRAIVQYPLTFP